MRLGRRLLLASLVALLGPAVAQAQDRSAENPPAAKATPLHPQLLKGQWQPVAEYDDASVLGALAEPMEAVRVWVRYEVWPSDKAQAGSIRTLYEADCRKKTLRSVLNVQYSANNLQGRPDFSGKPGPRTKPHHDSVSGFVLDTACAAQDIVDEALKAQGRESQVSAAARDSARFKATTGAWHALAVDRDVKLYVRGADAMDFPRLEVRLERLTPLMLADEPTLSSRHLLDLDCDSYLYRSVATTAFPRSNLKGAGLQIARDIEWKPMDGDIFAALVDICDTRLEDPRSLAPLAAVSATGAG